jgi:hypothetical protein
MQASTVMTQYMNDQLKEDMKRDELVANGKMSPVEAEVEATKWADVSEMKLSLADLFCLTCHYFAP